MPDSSRSKATAPGQRAGSTRAGGPLGPGRPGDVGRISIARTALAALLVVAGIAWIIVYINVTRDGQRLTALGDLGRWNYLIGFGLIFAGIAAAAHRSTPLGRGRGVVVGMLGCFLLGLVWIVVYYMSGTATLPLFTDLGQYNLVVGIGFMAVGFIYATHWE